MTQTYEVQAFGAGATENRVPFEVLSEAQQTYQDWCKAIPTGCYRVRLVAVTKNAKDRKSYEVISHYEK